MNKHRGYSVNNPVPQERAPEVHLPIEVDALYGCHLWAGKLDKRGYGRIGRRLAHRDLWEAEHGPLPKGKELDHLCRRRRCVNLDHLEPVTRSENERRKRFHRTLNFSSNARCRNGHDLSRYAMATPEGGKVCRRCINGR